MSDLTRFNLIGKFLRARFSLCYVIKRNFVRYRRVFAKKRKLLLNYSKWALLGVSYQGKRKEETELIMFVRYFTLFYAISENN